MPASKSSPSSARTKGSAGSRRASAGSGQGSTRSRQTAAAAPSQAAAPGGVGGPVSLVEQLTNSVIKPLDLVMLTRERIQDTLDEAAEQGRLNRSDANELVSELVRRGREQTDNLMADVERLLERGRDQIGSASKRTRLTEPVERIARGAGRVRRTVGGEPSLPIAGYDDLTARQATERLRDLTPADLRTVRDYERRHANRKSVLDAIERAIDA
jgi:polyhydroxyalkanoate synthesis regulator phasin